MADLITLQNRNRVLTDTDVTAAEAVTLDLSLYDTFVFTLKTTGAPALTWANAVAGRYYSVSFFLLQPVGADALKPTNSASTNSAGTTLIFHTSANALEPAAGGNAAWPTLSTTDSVWDYFRWISPDAVNFFLVDSVLALDE